MSPRKTGDVVTLQPVRKRRPLRRLFLLVLVVLLTLIILLPTVLSTRFGEQWLRRVLPPVQSGQLDFNDLQLSWRRGFQVKGLVWHDSLTGLRVQVANVTGQPKWSALLRGSLAGQAVIRQAQVLIDSIPELAEPNEVTSSVGLPKPATTSSLPFHLGNLGVVVQDSQVTLRHGTQSTTLAQIELDLAISDTNTTQLTLDMFVLGGAKPAPIHVDIQLDQPLPRTWPGLFPAGTTTVGIENLDLVTLEPLLALAGQTVRLQGTVELLTHARWQDETLTSLQFDSQGQGVEVRWPALEPDVLTTKTLALHAQVSEQEEQLMVQASIETDLAQLTADGVYAKTAITPAGLLAAPWTIGIMAEIPIWAAQLSHTLKLREGVQVTDGQLQGSLHSGGGRVQAEVKLTGLAGLYENRLLHLSQDIQALFTLFVDGQTVQLEQLEITAPFAHASLSGNVEQLAYQKQLDLAALQRELGVFIDFEGWQYEGIASTAGTLQVQDQKVTLTGTGTLQNLRISDPNGRQVVESVIGLRHALTLAGQEPFLLDGVLEIESGLGTLALAPVSQTAESQKETAWRVTGQGIDLRRIQPYAVLFADMNETIQFSGQAEMAVILRSEGRQLHIATETLSLSNLRIQRMGDQPFEQKKMTCDWEATLDLDQQDVTVEQFTLNSDVLSLEEMTLEKRTTGNQVTLQGQTECAYDWQQVAALVSAFVPAGLTLQGHRRDAIRFKTTYPIGQPDQRWTGLTAQAGVGFEQAAYQGLDVGPTEVTLVVAEGQFQLIPFRSTLNEGQFHFGCRADLTQQPLLIELFEPMSIAQDIHITGPLAAKLLKYVNPLFANLTQVSGRLDFASQQLTLPVAAAAQDQLVVIGTLAMREVLLEGSDLLSQLLAVIKLKPVRGQSLTVHPTDFTVKDGYVRYKNMQVDVGDNPLNFSGTIGLDDTLNMTVTLPYTWSGETINVGESSGDRIQLPLRGTLSEPQLDTARFLKEQLQEQLEKQIFKGLGELLERL